MEVGQDRSDVSPYGVLAEVVGVAHALSMLVGVSAWRSQYMASTPCEAPAPICGEASHRFKHC